MEKISIGELLKRRRDELSLTQRQVANQVGVTEATVSRWESGDIDNMRRDKIAGLARALRVSPLLIMGIDESEHSYTPVSNEQATVLRTYDELPADGRRTFLEYLDYLRFKYAPHVATL